MCEHKSFYDRHISPRLVHAGCSAEAFAQMRERIIPRARGIVVDIGFGSGLNLPHYDPRKVDLLIGIEPDRAMIALAHDALAATPVPAELHQGFAERLPLENSVADAVVVTYVLCTIPDPGKALQEIRRILKPGGTLLFCEHALASGLRGKLQRGLNGAWRKLFGGCNITRDPLTTIAAAGFVFDDVAAEPFPLPQFLLGMQYAGEARVSASREPERPVRASRREAAMASA
jgi:SAM-dependent methyltransferase